MKDQETSVDHLGITWKVVYNIHGKYYPATYEEPEEYPELEVISIEPWSADEKADYDSMVAEGEVEEDYLESVEFHENILQALFNRGVY